MPWSQVGFVVRLDGGRLSEDLVDFLPDYKYAPALLLYVMWLLPGWTKPRNGGAVADAVALQRTHVG